MEAVVVSKKGCKSDGEWLVIHHGELEDELAKGCSKHHGSCLSIASTGDQTSPALGEIQLGKASVVAVRMDRRDAEKCEGLSTFHT